MTGIKAVIILPEGNNDRTFYLLLEDFEFSDVTVPKGFITDGATIPRIFWPILPPVHRYFPAAVVHDYLLTQVSRDEADAEFNNCLKELNISTFRRLVMYGAVRLFAKWKKFKSKF